MNERSASVTLATQIQLLESSFNELLTMTEHLIQENHTLKLEKKHLVDKNKRIQTELEKILKKLKAMEGDSGQLN